MSMRDDDRMAPIFDAQPPKPELPYNIPVEQALLGAILVQNEVMHRVAFLDADHFFEPVHGRIFATCRRLIDRGQKATPIAIAPAFDRDDGLKDVGGSQYLARLAASVVSVVDSEDYARTVHDLARRRELIQALEIAIADAYDPRNELQADDMGRDVVAAIERIHEHGPDDDAPTTGRGAAQAAVQRACDVASGRIQPGIMVGLADLDKKLGGLKKSHLIAIGARPSMGKTAIEIQIAQSVARANPEHAVVLHSLEEETIGLGARLLARRVGIPYEDILRGNLDRQQLEQLARAPSEVPDNLHLFEKPGATIAQIRSRTLKIHRRTPVALVLVDHLQIMRPPRHLAGSGLREQISFNTMELKVLAKELHAPVVVLSQLSREVEKRDDKRPQLSDLRESGTIEQDADVVMFLLRMEYYLERSKPDDPAKQADWYSKLERHRGKIDVIIDKNRQGATGAVTLAQQIALNRFFDLAAARDDDVPSYASGMDL